MKNCISFLLLSLALSACVGNEVECENNDDCNGNSCIAGACVDPGEGEGEGEGEACVYPDDAPAVMTAGQTLPIFSWANGFLDDGSQVAVDLAEAPCGDNALFADAKALVFVSVPEW